MYLQKIFLNTVQYKIWLDNLLKQPCIEYNDINFTFKIEGKLNVRVLKEAVLNILHENPISHSFIKVENEKPYFEVDNNMTQFPFFIEDIPLEISRKDIEEKIEQLVYVPFNLEKEYPCRFYLLKNENKSFLVTIFHHVILDVKRSSDFFSRLSEIYSDVLEQSYSFKDNTQYYLDLLKYVDDSFEKGKQNYKSYWTNYVEDIPLHLALPKFTGVNKNNEVSYHFELREEWGVRINDICSNYHTSSFRVYAAIWALTLSKITHVQDFLVDYPVDILPKQDHPTIGAYINTLPLKFKLGDHNLTFIDILNKVNNDRREARNYQFINYRDIVDNNRHNDCQNIGVNVTVNYPLDFYCTTLNLVGCTVEPFYHVNVPLSGDLMLFIERSESIVCDLRYKKELPLSFIQSVSKTFCEILKQVLENPNNAIKDIRLISQEEEREYLDKVDRTLHECTATDTFLHFFEKTVKKTPSKIAVKYGDESLTYADIDRLSNIIATYLQLNYPPKCFIGLTTPKNLNMLPGIIGIMKSGNVYVPIDYELPIERIKFIYHDTHLSAVLVTDDTPHLDVDISIINIDQIVKDQSIRQICQYKVLPDDLAYVIYTSGTTGTPKGIPIEHGMLTQTLLTNIKIQHLDSSSKVIQFANICFDASIVELFPVLVSGGTLVLPSKEVRTDPKLLLAFLEREQITSANIPPVLLANMPQKFLYGLSTIVMGGDTTTPEAIEFWSENRRLINAYGPTENTVDATFALLNPYSLINDIGSPMSGVSCYVVDNDLHLMPNYTVGELCLGGVKLTKGYLNRNELNNQKFIDNPFVSADDKANGLNLKIYHTGDYVMRCSDGHFLFLGRIDNQIKLNGHRIELSEIENQIKLFSSEVKASVAMMSDSGDSKFLVAYVLVDKVDSFNTKKLQKFLMNRLPIYMVPRHIVALNEFPYNQSGKIDRKKLQDVTLYVKNNHIIEPATHTEKIISKIWSNILAIHPIDRNDDFLLLGGDSMLVIRMSFELEKEFGIEIRSSEIYEHSTLISLAEFIDKSVKNNSESTNVPQKHCEEISHLPLSPMQLSLWLQCSQSVQIKKAYNLPCLFECPEGTDIDVLVSSFNRLIKLQDGFRMYFPLGNDGQPYIKISDFSPLSLDLCSVTSVELHDHIRQDIQTDFNLEEGPLYHLVLYHVDGKRYYFSLVMHHLISDGWSAMLIQKIILDSIHGREVEWNLYNVSYQTFIRESIGFMKTSSYLNRLAFWKNYLGNVSDITMLKKGKGSNKDRTGNIYETDIPNDIAQGISDCCKQNKCTQFELCSSVYMLFLSKISNQTNFAMGFPYVGREKGEYKYTIGYFVNTLPICFKDEYTNMTFREYIKAYHDDIIRIEENAASFNDLLEIVRQNSFDSSTQLLQTMFVMGERAPLYDYISKEQVAFGLTFSILYGKDKWTCNIEYQYDCLSKISVMNLVESYLSLLNKVIRNFDNKIEDYSFVSDDYKKSVIYANTISNCLPTSLDFLNCFSDCVCTSSKKQALVYDNESISYKELDEKSTYLAQIIQNSGVKENSTIAVNMVASIDSISLIIGIWKAGCVYVPIDPNIPSKRRNLILEDSSCKMVFDQDNYPFGQSLINENSNVLEIEDCAYVIYTSGTTGVPKGVPITHEELGVLLKNFEEKNIISSNSRVLLFSSISFDASVTELFTTLSVGATLVIAKPEERKDPILLINLIEKQEITNLEISAPVLTLLPRKPLPSLNTIVVGGESIDSDILKSWALGRSLYNAYGPTENTVTSTICKVDESFQDNNIGFPLPGVACYVLDNNLKIVPAEIIGELYIGGLQLTKGYLNRDKLNQQIFIDNPYVSSEDKEKGINTRLYKTGDLVIRHCDGHLTFIGRKDRQIKINGYRIELSEIERHLLKNNNIKRVCVKVLSNDGRDELVAYIQSDFNLDCRNLQADLLSILPDYMVPTKWCVLQKFPLTINGKTDWKRMPLPQTVSEDTIVEPSSKEESFLLKIVLGILGNTRIGVESDLFNAGMTSMMGMRLIVAMAEQMNLKVTFSSLYECRTIRNIIRKASLKNFFWIEEPSDDKPVLIYVCGFPSYHPYFDSFGTYFKKYFSILVLDSYCDYFRGRNDISIKALLDYYIELLPAVLHERKIFAIFGYCSGAEVSMRLASRLKQENICIPKVLVLEGTYKRQGIGFPPAMDGSYYVQENFDIAYKIFKSFSPIDFDGDIIIALARNVIRKIGPFNDDQADDHMLEQIKKMVKKNCENWKEAYPHLPILSLDTDHWHLFEESVYDCLWNEMKRRWNIDE